LIGWRSTWGVTAAVIALVVLPLLLWLLSQDRAPVGRAAGSGSPGLGGVHWRRAEVLRHWTFWALVPFFLTPGFIGTVIFFHQVHVAEVKGWSLTAMATGYSTYATATIATSFAAGWVVDRFGPAVLLPVATLPTAAAMAYLGPASQVADWIAILTLQGVGQGMVSTLAGTLLPAVYGTDHLGSVRGMVVALMVLSTAIGPGITGVFIDLGVTFPEQGSALALWCVTSSPAHPSAARSPPPPPPSRGDIRWVRPRGPAGPRNCGSRWPRSGSPGSGASWSGFIARHMEQPASRHSNPASLKMSASPSSSACARTRPEPGTTMARFTVLDLLALQDRGGGAQILDPAIGAGADEDRVDLDLRERRAGRQPHVVQRPRAARDLAALEILGRGHGGR
jgi:hypothetical protein